jgi:hypothetical protein
MPMEGITTSSWLRCYRCWSTNLEVQVHYEGIHRIDPDTGERADVVDEMQEAVVQCLDCMHDQPHLGFQGGRVEPIEDRWERMVMGTPWVASCTVTVESDDVETCSRAAVAHLAGRGVPASGCDWRRPPLIRSRSACTLLGPTERPRMSASICAPPSNMIAER